MFTFTACRGSGFEILSSPSGSRDAWRGSLASLFHVAKRLVDWTWAEIRCGSLRQPASLLGKLERPSFAKSWRHFAAQFERQYPLELVSPFEETDSIAGAVWPGSIIDPQRDDGLAKLRFDAGTRDLPMHVHENSDRCILVLQGRGLFHLSNATLDTFSGRDIRTVSVQPGQVLVFTRGLLHTFSTNHEPLVLLSYHAPLIPFNDPLQYTVSAFRWTAGAALQTRSNTPAHAATDEVLAAS